MRSATILQASAVALACAAWLSGCAELREFDRAATKTLKGAIEAVNASPSPVKIRRRDEVAATRCPGCGPVLTAVPHREAAEGTSVCGKRQEDVIRANVDVDTAYVRLKRHFGYPTLEERKRRSYGGWIDEGFRHETTPGARYWMKDEVRTVVGGKPVVGWLSTEIEKDGDGSLIRLRYCVGGSEGFQAGPDFPKLFASQVREVAEGRKRP